MLAGSCGLAATLWWTPFAFIVAAAAIATVLALPARSPLQNYQDIL
jgi:hypothetical protein